MSTAHSYSQTITRLYKQLSQDGYTKTDLRTLHDTYELAMQLFTCMYRPSGKTFMAHLVGVGSILGTLHAPIELVAAGVIHSAYSDGEFGDGERGVSHWKREQVRRTVGKEIEEYVARYCATEWKDERLPAIVTGLASLNTIDRAVLLLRLANDLEDNLDGGILYCPNVTAMQKGISLFGGLKVKLAKTLGYPTLALELERVYLGNRAAAIPATLQQTGSLTRSFSLLPLTYVRPVSHVLRTLMMRNRRVVSDSSSQRKTRSPEKDNVHVPRGSALDRSETLENKYACFEYAQTNIQLYRQILERGYSAQDIDNVRQAYELAIRLFAGKFQTHGKTVIAHVVGTASILVSLRAPVTIVTAGLLHNAFWGGDFADGTIGVTEARRKYIRRHVGQEVEEYLVGFANLNANEQTASLLRARVFQMSQSERHVVLLYLADNLEHNLDAGVLYYNDAQRRLYLNAEGHMWADMANELGFSKLAEELRRVYSDNAASQLPWSLLAQGDQIHGMTLVPRSCRKRLFVTIRQAMDSALNHLPRWLRAQV
jgi:HD domain